MEAIVYKVAESKSGNHDIITFVTEETKKTPFGTATQQTYYNLLMEKGTVTCAEDEKVDLDLDAFTVEISQLDRGISRWLRFKS